MGEHIRIPFLFKTCQYFIVCFNHILFTHSSVNGDMGCFHLLTIVGKATDEHKYTDICLDPAVNSFGNKIGEKIVRKLLCNYGCGLV